MPILKNARYERFAQAIAKGKSADEAYILAGYKAHRGNASTLRANQHVEARVREILAAGAKRAEISEEMVLRELGRIGFADIRRAIRWGRRKASIDDGEATETNEVEFLDSDQIDDETAAAIAEVSQLSGGGIRIKFHDKKGALTDLGRHFGMFKDKIELGGHVQVANLELLGKLTREERAEMKIILETAKARQIAANQNEDEAPGGVVSALPAK